MKNQNFHCDSGRQFRTYLGMVIRGWWNKGLHWEWQWQKANFAHRAKITARISHLAVGTFLFFQKKTKNSGGG